MAIVLRAIGAAATVLFRKALGIDGDLSTVNVTNGNKKSEVINCDSKDDSSCSGIENVNVVNKHPVEEGEASETTSPLPKVKKENKNDSDSGAESCLPESENLAIKKGDSGNKTEDSTGTESISHEDKGYIKNGIDIDSDTDSSDTTSSETEHMEEDNSESCSGTDHSEEECERNETDTSDSESTESEDNYSGCDSDEVSNDSVNAKNNDGDVNLQNMNGTLPINNALMAVRHCKKIQYDPLEVIAVGEGVKVYKGTYEGRVETAVKVSCIDITDIKKVSDELKDLHQKLNKTVLINQKIMAVGNSNVVKYFCHEFDHVDDRVQLLIALERCYCNLYEFIRERSKLPKISDKDIYKQLTSGLHFLHSRKIVHRDLKPSNVVIKLEQNGSVQFKLSDFGMAKTPTDSESGTSVSGPCGTYGWMAPEVYKIVSTQPSEDFRHRFLKTSDIFPLGQLFYFVASKGFYVYKNQDAIQKDDADYAHMPGRNDPLLSLLRRMLSQNPTDRPCANEILNHPALWTEGKTLDFFQNVSDILESEPNRCPIENNSSNILRGEWQQYLTKRVERHLFPTVRGQQHKIGRFGPRYRRKSVQSLIRAIRNNKMHYLELSADLKKSLDQCQRITKITGPVGFRNFSCTHIQLLD